LTLDSSSETWSIRHVIRSTARLNADQVIAQSTAELMQRFLQDLKVVLPYDAAQLLVFDRTNDRHHELARDGYSSLVAGVMAHEFTKDWPKPIWSPVNPGDNLPPTIGSEQDFPDSFRQSEIYQKFLHPAGYRDGLTFELHHRGRYVGLVNISSKTPNFYSDDIRRRSAAMSAILGYVANATAREMDRVPSHSRAAVLSRNGQMAPLAGRRPSRLAQDPEFVAAIAPLFTMVGEDVNFLWNLDRQWFRVHVQHERDDFMPGAEHLVIVEEPIIRPFGLTPTQIRVLTYMSSGPTNDAIAAALSISIRTVHSHVASILAKLGCTRRSQAISSALRNGLFRPEPNTLASLERIVT
jgi:DNA-binding CsgD family transcriptional regulator